MKPILVYSPRYDVGLPGFRFLHPFDGRKFSRAWDLVQRRFGEAVRPHWVEPDRPVPREDLLRVHTGEYLDSLDRPSTVARALEVWLLRFFPRGILDRCILEPMRYATQGTILAVSAALKNGLALNLGGGFHHAHRDHGEGFCLYADVAVSIEASVARGLLKPDASIAVIDLDAHRGNGLESIYRSRTTVQFLDLYNFQVYPGMLCDETDRYPFVLPMKLGKEDGGYLRDLREDLPRFLQSLPGVDLAFYNAGTDILAGDRLGGLSVSEEGVLERDRFVIDSLVERRIPTVMVTSGGYTKRSYVLIARTLSHVLEKHAGLRPLS